MPTISRRAPSRVSALPHERVGFDLSGKIATALVGMLATLICTGVMSMITLYTRVTTLTDNVQTMQTQMQRTIDHGVDRDEYLRRDVQIQRALDSMATKDELKAMQRQLDEQTESLRVIEGAVSSRVGRRASVTR